MKLLLYIIFKNILNELAVLLQVTLNLFQNLHKAVYCKKDKFRFINYIKLIYNKKDKNIVATIS